MKQGKLFAPAIAIVLLTGCMKEELPVPARDRGDAASHQVCTGAGYSTQLWFDLGTGTVRSQNDRAAWDFAFQCAPDGWRVMLNGAKLMTAWDLGAVDITASHDTVGMAAARRIDAPSGHPDSTAIGDWRGANRVFLIDRGYDAFGLHTGFLKLRMGSVDAQRYTFETAALDGSGLASFSVDKDATRSHTCFRVGQGVVPIEPAAGAWDFCFTQYTHQFYEPFMPYLVNGVLSAPGVHAARITGKEFEAITIADTLAHPLESRRNVIGYDWKYYSFETASYTIVPGLSYIVRDAEGYLFKIRFVDFYGEQGQVGCPKFEAVPL